MPIEIKFHKATFSLDPIFPAFVSDISCWSSSKKDISKFTWHKRFFTKLMENFWRIQKVLEVQFFYSAYTQTPMENVHWWLKEDPHIKWFSMYFNKKKVIITRHIHNFHGKDKLDIVCDTFYPLKTARAIRYEVMDSKLLFLIIKCQYSVCHVKRNSPQKSHKLWHTHSNILTHVHQTQSAR